MSMQIYAGKTETHPDFGQVMGPVIGFEHWDRHTLAEDADARYMRGEEVFIPNPDFVEDAGTSLASANARALFAHIGLELEEDSTAELDLEMVHSLAMRALNGPAPHPFVPATVSRGAMGATMIDCGTPEGYMADQVRKLLAIIEKGRRFGATHLCVI